VRQAEAWRLKRHSTLISQPKVDLQIYSNGNRSPSLFYHVAAGSDFRGEIKFDRSAKSPLYQSLNL
jgi:hypothetical protein